MPDNREETTELKDVDVQYISLVHRGANRQRFQLFKSQDYDPANFSKGATSFQDLPKADEERDWDGDRAVESLKIYASSDGSGDKDTIDWSKYKRGFFWYNEDEPEKFGSYKLPFAEVIDGQLKAVWNGVNSAMASLNGARGNRPDIPEDDFEPVYNHIKQYYEKFGEEAPELSKSAEELSKEERGLIEVIKNFLVDKGLMKGEEEEVKKEVPPISWQTNYDEALDEVQTREGMERIEFMFDLLKDTIWNIYHLENDVENPAEAVRDAVESFANRIVDVINNNQGEIKKWYEEVKKQKEGGTIDMGEVNQETLEELTKGITNLNDKIEGLSNRLNEVEKEEQNPEGNEPEEGEEVEKSEEEGQEGEEEDTIEKSVQELTDTVQKAVDKLDNLEDRVETVEKARDISNDPGDDDVQKGDDDGDWSGLYR